LPRTALMTALMAALMACEGPWVLPWTVPDEDRPSRTLAYDPVASAVSVSPI
jgi:hypothetical protein